MSTPKRTADVLAADYTAKLRKKFGANVLAVASKAPAVKFTPLPTGILPLDYALGGGFAAGRVHVIYGHKSSAKSTVVLKTIASAQKRCASCFTIPVEGKCSCGTYREAVVAYIDVEGAFDAGWAEKLGVDNDRLLLSRPEYAEQAIDVMDALLRSGDCDMLCVDSLAFLAVAKELEESAEKTLVGNQALKMGTAMRKFNMALNWLGNEHDGRKPTILLVNQIRMKVGLLFGNPETQPGGLAPGFMATSETLMKTGKYEMDEATDRPLYADFAFRIEKNKGAVPKIEGDFRLYLADTETKKVGQIADEGFIVKMSEKFSLMERKGTAGAITFCGQSFRSMDAIEQKLAADPAFHTQASEMLMAVLLAL